MNSCSPPTTTQSNAIDSFAHARTYTPDAFRLLLAKWVTSSSRPYSIIEDTALIAIFKMLHGKVTLISARTLSRDILLLHEFSKMAVVRTLKVSHYIRLQGILLTSLLETQGKHPHFMRWMVFAQRHFVSWYHCSLDH